MNLGDLKKEFGPNDLEWRVQSSGEKNGKPWAKIVPYITNRAIMDRLDEVCGPANWENKFEKGPEGGILCGISILCGEGEWENVPVTKWDGAENTNIEEVKGGLSAAMKRAAVQWGIGRYLYNLPVAWAIFTKNGKYSSKINDIWYKWDAPELGKIVEDPVHIVENPLEEAAIAVENVKKVFVGETTKTGQVTFTFKDIIKWVNDNTPPNMGEIVDRAKKAENNQEALNALYKEISKGSGGGEQESQTLLGNDDIPF